MTRGGVCIEAIHHTTVKERDTEGRCVDPTQEGR